MSGYYAVMVAGSGDQDLCVFHHDDPEAGSSGWTNVGQMTYRNSIKTLWAEQDADLIHIVVQCDDGKAYYNVFDTSGPGVDRLFNTPGSQPRGLAWDGTYFWHCDASTDLIYKLDPSDGSVVSSFAAPETFGLTWDGTHLRASDASTDLIYKLDPSDGSVVSSFASPGAFPRGLAWDGTYLWHVDSGSLIYKLDPSSGSVVSSFSTPDSSSQSYGLAWDGTHLLFTRWEPDSLIYRIDPSTGSVVSTSANPESGHNENYAVAWDGSYVWGINGIKDRLYRINPSGGFTASKELIATATNVNHSVWGCAVVKRSNGEIVAAFMNATNGSKLSRRVSGTWQAPSDGSGGSVPRALIAGTSSRIIGYSQSPTSTSGGKAILKADNTVVPSGPVPYATGIGAKRGTNEYFVPLLNNGGADIAIQHGPIEDDFTNAVTDTISASITPYKPNNMMVAAVAADGTDIHVLYVDNATQDLWHDKDTGSGFGTDVEILDGVTVSRVNAMVYDHGGTKLAYLYDDAGVVKYGEVTIGAAPTNLVIQNASHGHTVENAALTQVHGLALQDAAHTHSAENQVLTQLHVLALQDTLHDVASDNIVLEQIYNLIVDDSLHSHITDNIDLDQAIMQRAYAMGTIATNGWFAVGAASVHEALNETSPNDSTYVEF